MTRAQIEAEVSTWQAVNLDECGRYTGKDLADFGFPWEVGEYVDITERWSAMATHRQAETARMIYFQRLAR